MATTGLGGPVALIGAGLIGGSLGLALRDQGVASEVRGVDPAPGAVQAALERGAITVGCDSVAEAVDGAEVVVVCAPVGEIPGLVQQVLATAGEGTVVTDVGSAKSEVLSHLSAAERERFCGGHPVAGGVVPHVPGLAARQRDDGVQPEGRGAVDGPLALHGEPAGGGERREEQGVGRQGHVSSGQARNRQGRRRRSTRPACATDGARTAAARNRDFTTRTM